MSNNVTDTSRPVVNRIQTLGIAAAVIGIIGMAAGFVMAPEHIYQSYLIGFVMWNGIAVSCLGLLMLHHMVGGEWGYVNRRIFEAGAMVTVVFALLAIPIVLPQGIHALYEWSHPEVVANDTILREKAPYLNSGFFTVRVVIYFLFWVVCAFLLNKWSADVDKTGSASYRTKVRALSAPGILAYVLIYTFYMVDFLMSLEPHWFSTIFGLLMMIGATLSTLSLTAILMWQLKNTQPLSHVLTKDRFWDIGNLMLALTMLWTYMAFSQYLISWAGNLPEEADFYEHRLAGPPFQYVIYGLAIFHFAVPFFLLLQRAAKKAPVGLASIGVMLIVMRFVDIYWIVKPSFTGQPAAHFSWTDIVAPIAFGGIFLTTFCFFYKSKLVLPVYETHHDRPPIKSEVYTHG